MEKIYKVAGKMNLLEFVQQGGKKLELTETAFENVLKGNFVVCLMKDEDMKVLSVRLHACEAWIDFRSCYEDDLKHLHFYNSEQHTYWYYDGVNNLADRRYLI